MADELDGNTPPAIRQRIAKIITDSGNGYTEAQCAFDLFPGPSRAPMHKSFSVGLISTRPVPGHRQRASTLPCVTMAEVRFALRIRGDNQIVDTDAALAAEWELCSILSGGLRTTGMQMRFAGVTTRRVVGDGTVWLGAIQLEVHHNLTWIGDPTPA